MKIGIFERLERSYTESIDSIRDLLKKTQSEMAYLEKQGEPKSAFLGAYQQSVFKDLDSHIKALEVASSHFTDRKHKAHKKYLRKTIHSFAMQSPFNRRCFEKPLGYPGDFMMMEMIYSDPYQGDSSFAQLLNAHSILSLPICEAVRKRGLYTKRIIDETVREKPNAAILSIGSGPAWDIREHLLGAEDCRASFYLLDQEKKALEFVKEKTNGNGGSVSFLHRSVMNLLRRGMDMKFDLIYCAGLYDYLPASFAKRLTLSMYDLLEDGGKLVIGNASHNPFRIWMEHGVDWYLIYRNKEDFTNLADGLYPIPRKIDVDESDESGKLFIFLHIEK